MYAVFLFYGLICHFLDREVCNFMELSRAHACSISFDKGNLYDIGVAGAVCSTSVTSHRDRRVLL